MRIQVRWSYAGVVHRDIVNVDVLNDVKLSLVLSQRANTYSMGSIAEHVLNDHIGTIWLEGDTICKARRLAIAFIARETRIFDGFPTPHADSGGV